MVRAQCSSIKSKYSTTQSAENTQFWKTRNEWTLHIIWFIWCIHIAFARWTRPRARILHFVCTSRVSICVSVYVRAVPISILVAIKQLYAFICICIFYHHLSSSLSLPAKLYSKSYNVFWCDSYIVETCKIILLSVIRELFCRNFISLRLDCVYSFAFQFVGAVTLHTPCTLDHLMWSTFQHARSLYTAGTHTYIHVYKMWWALPISINRIFFLAHMFDLYNTRTQKGTLTHSQVMQYVSARPAYK